MSKYKRKGQRFKPGDRVCKKSDGGYKKETPKRPPVYGRIIEYKAEENSIGRLIHVYQWLPDGKTVPEPTTQSRLTLVKEEPIS